MQLKISKTCFKILIFIQRNKRLLEIIFIVKCFSVYCRGQKLKKCSCFKHSLFPRPFRLKYVCIAKKKIKRLKIEDFDQTSEKRTHPESEQF